MHRLAVAEHGQAVAGHRLAVAGHRLAVVEHRLAVAEHSQDDRIGPSIGSVQIGLQEGVVAFADSLAVRKVVIARLSSFDVTCR